MVRFSTPRLLRLLFLIILCTILLAGLPRYLWTPTHVVPYETPPRPSVTLDATLPSTQYRQFPIPPSPKRASLLPVPILPQPCLSSWLTAGSLSDPSCTHALTPLPKDHIDFAWTWLNGSDPLWLEHKRKYSTMQEIGRVQRVPDRHYQDHGELRYSIRSAHAALPGIARSWVVLGDWGVNLTRLGQRPDWLRETDDVRTVFHSEIWGGFTREERDWEERLKFLEGSLPTFNSFSIEAHLHNIPELSPHFVYMNDDFFLLAPHESTDFHTPYSLFGPIIPFAFAELNFTHPGPPRIVRGKLERLPRGFVGVTSQHSLSCNHEYEALSRSNYWLGARFGHRRRPILLHIPKPLLTPIMHEVAVIWGERFLTRSTKRKFREDARHQPGDFHSLWLTETLMVERAREAMLWTWAVVKMGEQAEVKGKWAAKERAFLRDLFGVPQIGAELQRIEDMQPPTFWSSLFGRPKARAENVTIPTITLENRHTLSASHLRSSLAAVHAEVPKQNIYGWTSLDGVCPPLGASVRKCTIDFEDCFGTWWNAAWFHNEVKADAIFKRIAFEKPNCGDCILSSLILASGPLGMSQLLPDPTSFYIDNRSRTHATDDGEGETTPQPHLPLTMEWKTTDFSLSAVLGEGSWGSKVNLRDWCEKLIGRYTWTAVVNSTSHFAMVGSEKPLNDTIEQLEAVPPPSSAVLNDDFTMDTVDPAKILESQRTARRLVSWLSSKWSTVQPWERIDS